MQTKSKRKVSPCHKAPARAVTRGSRCTQTYPHFHGEATSAIKIHIPQEVSTKPHQLTKLCPLEGVQNQDFP